MVGIVIVTHGHIDKKDGFTRGLAQELLKVAKEKVVKIAEEEKIPAPSALARAQAVAVAPDEETDKTRDNIIAAAKLASEGASDRGVIILVDMPGATPWKQAVRAMNALEEEGYNAETVSSVNAPAVIMLMKKSDTIKWPDAVNVAREAICKGVICCHQPENGAASKAAPPRPADDPQSTHACAPVP